MNNLESIPAGPTPAYILSPAKTVTGGPEFCEQICAELNTYPNIDAKMLYVTHQVQPHPEVYARRYHNFYTVNHKPEKGSIVFIPEVCSNLLYDAFLEDCKTIFFVWMSVNNYLATVDFKDLNNFPSNVIHLSQSAYSFDYLTNFAHVKREKILPLGDYISQEFIKESKKEKKKEKEDLITIQYNKSSFFAYKVLEELYNRKASEKLKINMIKDKTTEEIINILSKSKIFLNLGWNPGMDRMNREAVVLDNCIVSSKLGSGYYLEDVPIADNYKFEVGEKQEIKRCADVIEDCVGNYEDRIKDFIPYKEMVLGQKKIFKDNIKGIVEFIKG